MKEFFLELDGEFLRVKAQKIKGKLWYHLEDRTLSYSPHLKIHKGDRKSPVSNPKEITAPMPGKIIKLLKKQGDLVKSGDTVVVMEAMKMEYNLKVQHSMIVSKILCQENETVELGEKLVEMEEVVEGL